MSVNYRLSRILTSVFLVAGFISFPESIALGAEKQESKIQSPKKQKKSKKELARSIETYMEFRYERQQLLTKWLNKLKEKFTNLEKRIETLNEDTRENWKKEIEALKTKRENLKEKFNDIQNSSKDTWIKVKWSFGEALETYEENLKKALKNLKDEEDQMKQNKGE